MNINERLNTDSYFNHIRQTSNIIMNYINMLETQENNLANLLNNRNVLNQHNNTTRWRSYYPTTQNRYIYNRRIRDNLFTPNRVNIPSNRLTNNEMTDFLTKIKPSSELIDEIVQTTQGVTVCPHH